MAGNEHACVVGRVFRIPFSPDKVEQSSGSVPKIGIDNPVAAFRRDITDWGSVSPVVYRNMLTVLDSSALWLAHNRTDTYVGQYIYRHGELAGTVSPFLLGVDIDVKPQMRRHVNNLRLMIKSCGQIYSGYGEVDDGQSKIVIRRWIYSVTNECVPLCWDQRYPAHIGDVQYLLMDITRPVDLTKQFV